MELNKSKNSSPKRYKSTADWLEDIAYLKWPFLLVAVLVFLIVLLIDLNLI